METCLVEIMSNTCFLVKGDGNNILTFWFRAENEWVFVENGWMLFLLVDFCRTCIDIA